jgi:hypothetical protein
MVRIIAAIFSIESMRKLSSNLNDTEIIENVYHLLGAKAQLDLPHHDTINNCHKQVDPQNLSNICTYMAESLIRSPVFDDSRIRGKYWQVLIDGTPIYSFGRHKYCSQCLYKIHNKGTDNEWTEYYHTALEAKLVLNDNIVISLGTEFIENDGSEDLNQTPGRVKQDSELKAFYRLVARIKQEHPRLRMCLTMDSLYCCQEVFGLCRDYGWTYIIRFKDGSIKSLAQSFYSAVSVYPGLALPETVDGHRLTYIMYRGFTINAVECTDSNIEYPFVFITDLPLDDDNCSALVRSGRNRWAIEDQGFDTQKHHDYNLCHVFCQDSTAMKNHYMLIQIAHIISQLLEHAVDLYRILKLSLSQFHQLLLESFKKHLDDNDLKAPKRRAYLDLHRSPYELNTAANMLLGGA